MKKKIIVLLGMILMLCCVLCACGGAEPTENSHVEVEGKKYGLAEINKIAKENEIKFKNDFEDKTATVVGKVETISGKCTYNGASLDSYIKIDDWFVNTSGYEDILATLSEGDVVKVTGTMTDNFGSEIYIWWIENIEKY